MVFEKQCGGFTLQVSNPAPSWVTLRWGGDELVVQTDPNSDASRPAHIKAEDLRDLRYLIDSALGDR